MLRSVICQQPSDMQSYCLTYMSWGRVCSLQMKPQPFVRDGWLAKFVDFLVTGLDTSLRGSEDYRGVSLGSVGASPRTESSVLMGKAPLSFLRDEEYTSSEAKPCQSNSPSSYHGTASGVHGRWDVVNPVLILMAMGELASSVGRCIEPYVNRLLPHILSALQQHRRSLPKQPLSDDMVKLIIQNIKQLSLQMLILDSARRGTEYEALWCIVKLVETAGPGMIVHIPAIISQICSGTFSVSHAQRESNRDRG